MKLATFAAYTLAFSFASADPIIGDSVNCRSGPGTSYDIKKTYRKDHDVSITCQTQGTSVNGNSIWHQTSDGCYVADSYVETGSNGHVKDECDTSPNPLDKRGKIPGPVTNDYPYKNNCGGVDKWRYYKCQCTSFVAWRINERLGIKFTNRYKGASWGDAKTWDEAARRSRVRIDNKPVPGCIAQTNAGPGHVAWVTKVSGNSVTIEEYNWNVKKGYGKRTVPKSKFNYIHIKV